MYLVHFEPVGDEHEHCSRETDWSEDGPGLYTSHPSRHIAHRPSSSGPHRHTSQASATPFYAGTGSCHVAAVAVVQAIMSPCHWARSQGRQTFFKKIDFLGFFLFKYFSIFSNICYAIFSTDFRHEAPDIAKIAAKLLASHESDFREGLSVSCPFLVDFPLDFIFIAMACLKCQAHMIYDNTFGMILIILWFQFIIIYYKQMTIGG